MKPQCMILKAVLLVACAMLFSSCREQIIHNVSEYEANRLLSSLQDMAIDAAKEKQADGAWAISVPNADSLRAIKFVSDSRMVREPVSVVASKSSLVMSRDEQRFAYERSLSREIETTLLSVPGVLEARVHLNIASTDPLLERRADDSRGTASVLLLIESQRLVTREEIAVLVSGASGVPANSVAVVVAEDPRSKIAVGPSYQAKEDLRALKPSQLVEHNEKSANGLPAAFSETLTNSQQNNLSEETSADLTSQPLFSPPPSLSADEPALSIPLSNSSASNETKILEMSSWQRAKAYLQSWNSNFSFVRLALITVLTTLLVVLYLYGRRLNRGTGIPADFKQTIG